MRERHLGAGHPCAHQKTLTLRDTYVIAIQPFATYAALIV
jgi:hypothetical protein